MPNLDLRRPAAVGLALLSAILVLGAGSAGAAGTLVAYNMYPLVSDSAAVQAPLADSAFVNGWGLSASATSPWWSSNKETNTSTLYTGVGSKNALVVTVAGRADRHDRERRARPTSPVSQNGVSGAVALPVRHARRPDPRLDADGERDERGRRRRQLRAAAPSTPASRPRTTGCTRPTSTTPASTRSTPRSSRSALPLQGSEHPRRLGAVRHPGARREHLRHLRQAGPAKKTTPSRAAGSATSTSSAPTGRSLTRVASKGNANAPLNAPWGLAMAPANFGAYSGDLLVGQLRQRPDQRLPAPLDRQQVGLQGPGPRRERYADRDRRPLGDRVRQRRLGRTDEQPVLRRRPVRRHARPVRLHRRRLTLPRERGPAGPRSRR